MAEFSDFNLHNLFGLRLVDAPERAVKAVQRQLGIPPSKLPGQPDLTVRYASQLETLNPMRHLVMGESGFTEDAFFAVVSAGPQMYRAKIPFAELGQPCEIVCEVGIGEIPFLNLVINLRMLAKGLMPIHASAFMLDGMGVLVSGWPKGGKTSTLFSFLANGAQFVSDDWLFVDENNTIYGLPQPVKLSDWQLEQLPDFQAKVSQRKQWGIRTVKWLDAMEQRVPSWARDDLSSAKMLHRSMRYLNRTRRHVYLSPQQLFDDTVLGFTGRLDMLLLTLSHESPEITVTATDPGDALERLLASLRYEWMKWAELYAQFLYAFPGRRNTLMDEAESKQRNILKKLIADKPAYLICHPHPVTLADLYMAVSTVTNRGRGETQE